MAAIRRRVLSNLVMLGWIGGSFLLALGCSDANVEAAQHDMVMELDDQLVIKGRVCSQPPDESQFPVKIMFIVDCSGSLQQTDEGDHRVEAVRQVVRRYANSPHVYFDVVKFNGKVADLTKGFKHLTGNEAEVFGPQGILEADSMTDYQGGLAAVYQILLNDMSKTLTGQGGQAELTRTKYVVIFFSDGTPDPVCFGCVTEPPNHPRYMPACAGAFNPNSRCCNPDLHVMCTLMDDFIINMDARTEGMFPGLPEDGGTDYNHNYQIFQLIDNTMELKDRFQVGELRIHTGFLYCRDAQGNATTPLCAAAELAYGLDPVRGRALLREIARRGAGTFRDFTSGQSIDFLKIDYTSIRRTFRLKNLLVTNTQAYPERDEFLADSDGDGLPDEQEKDLGTNPLSKDTDEDGYSDFLELKWQRSGFDPLDKGKPNGGCPAKQDADGDGLKACEEAMLGTDDKLVDSDKDGFPDSIEALYGTDPLVNDMDLDVDADGLRSSDELLYHSHPMHPDQALWSERRPWYEINEQADLLQDRNCYDFTISHLTLLTTQDRNGPSSRGFNDILLWFAESPYDDPLDPGKFRVACVRAQYIAPDYKIPVGGEITLTDENFVSPANLDLGFDDGSCVTGTESK